MPGTYMYDQAFFIIYYLLLALQSLLIGYCHLKEGRYSINPDFFIKYLINLHICLFCFCLLVFQKGNLLGCFRISQFYPPSYIIHKKKRLCSKVYDYTIILLMIYILRHHQILYQYIRGFHQHFSAGMVFHHLVY